MKSTETILAEIQKDITHYTEKQDRCFEELKKQQDKKNTMTDNRITRVEEDYQKQLDNHCPRIRAMEKNLGEMNVQEEIGEIKKVQAVRISNLTKVIAALAIGATLCAQKIWEFIIS